MTNIVWKATLDDKYDCRVGRVAPYRGKLEMRKGKELLMEADVGLSYDAKFGPDVGDVTLWEEMCMKVANAQDVSG